MASISSYDPYDGWRAIESGNIMSLNPEFEDKEYRAAFVEEIVKTGVAFQIRALREHQEKNQGELAELIGTKQSVISRLEDPNYGKFSIKTLIDLASAFDVGLMVRFVSFAKLQTGLEDLSPKALAVPSYLEEKNQRHQS